MGLLRNGVQDESVFTVDHWDKATYIWLKIANVSYPFYLAPWIGVILVEFLEKLYGS